jgi:hypothetical protein
VLFGRRKRAPRSADGGTAAGALEPILVDYFTRDGSTLMMRLLSTSPQIAVGGGYPYEHKYFAYLYRWARMLERPDWPRPLWSGDRLATLQQEAEMPFLGPPPWLPRHLLEPERSGETIWREFSRRAASYTRKQRGDGSTDVRYYAEKHLNTWAVDLDELPPVRVMALLRDPRDTYVSIHAFNRKRREAGTDDAPQIGQRMGESDEEWLTRHLERQRDRLRWIRRAIKKGTMEVFRYEDMVRNLPAQAARLEEWLDVRLDPEAVAVDEDMRRTHVTAESPDSSIGRWRREMSPELVRRFNDELGPELKALGFEGPDPEPSDQRPAGVSESPARSV